MKATPFSAHPLATEPGTPVRFTLQVLELSSAEDEIRTHNLSALNGAPLPIGLQRHRWAPRDRTWKLRVQGPAGLPVPLPPNENGALGGI